jgi:hypothetical protein
MRICAHCLSIVVMSFWSAAATQLSGQHAGPSSARGTVTVQNNRDVPVTVYVDHAPLEVRIGTVAPMQIASLPLPEGDAVAGREVRFYLHPSRGPDLKAEAFIAHPGARIGLMIPDRSGARAAAAQEAARMTAVLPLEERSATTLTVENRRPGDDAVFLDWGPFETRLGMVPGGSTATFRVPQNLLGRSLEIVIRPHQGQDLESESITVRPGEHLGVRIPAV